jgi:hypothetical protein
MARKVEKKRGLLPFGPRNWRWLMIAAATIVVGYIFLSIGPWDSFWSLTLAPILLGAGYFVLMPIAILARNEPREPREPGEAKRPPAE